MSGGIGDVNLTLGLNTGPGQVALQKFVTDTSKSANKSAKAMGPVDTKLGKLVKTAKKLGFEYDKTGKVFRNGFGKTKSLDEMTKKVKKLDDALDKLNGAAKNAADGIKGGFANALQSIPQGIGIGVGQQLLGMFTALPKAAARAGKEAVLAFAEIDRALRQTLSIAGEDAARFGELTKFMNELAAATKFTAVELANTSVQLARAGYSADEMMQALPGIAQGAAAAGETMESMANTVVTAMGGFQLAADETGNTVDVLTAAANSSNTSVSDLGEGLKYVGPVAKSLGMSLEDTAAAAGLLANSGIKASQMGTTLRSGLGRLAAAAAGTDSAFAQYSRGTGRLSGVLKELGADIKDSNGNLLQMPQLLKKLKGGFDQLQGTEKALAAKILFGEEAGSGWISLLNKSAAETEAFFATTNNAAGVAAETAKQNLADISGSLDLLSSAIGSVQASIGQFASAALKPVIDGLTSMLNLFNGLPGPIQTAAMATVALGVAIGGAVLAYGLLKAAGVGAFFATALTSAGQLTAGIATMSSVIMGSAVRAFGLLAAKALALNAAMAATSATKFAGMIGNTIVLALKKAATAALMGGLSIANFGVVAAKGFLTATGAAIKFALAMAPLGAAALAVGSLAAVFQTWTAIGQQANEIGGEFGTTVQEMTANIEGLTAAQQTGNQAWETTVERVGGFQAALDVLRSGLGLTTAEEAELNAATVQIGESMAIFDTQTGKAKDKLAEYAQIMATAEDGSDEFNAAQEKYVQVEGEITKAIGKNIQTLTKQRDALKGKEASNEGVSEAEKRLLTTIEAAIKGLTAEKKILEGIRPSAISAAGGLDELGNASERAAIKVKEATAQLKDAKSEMDQIMGAMKESFSNQEAKIKLQFESDTSGVQEQIAALKQLESANEAMYNKQKEKAAGASQQAKADSASRIASIKEANAAEAAAGTARLEKVKAQNQEEIAALGRKAEASQQFYANDEKKAEAIHQRQMGFYQEQLRIIQQRTAASDAEYQRKLGLLQQLTPAEQQLAAIAKQKLETEAKMGGEEGLRAKAQLERMAKNEEIAALEKQNAEAKKQQEQEVEAVRAQMSEQEVKRAQSKERIQARAAAQATKDENALAELRAQKAEEEKKLADEIAAVKEANDKKAEQRATAADTVAGARADKGKEREAARKAQQEEIAAKIKQLEDEIEEKKKEYDRKRKDREDAYGKKKKKILDGYNIALGKNANYIVSSGDTAWTKYANQAIKQIDRVLAKQRQLAAAGGGGGGGGSLPNTFVGGHLQGGRLTHINEMGQEAFLSDGGDLSMIKAKPNSVWRVPENGTIIPAHIAANLGVPDKGMNIDSSPTGGSSAARNATNAASGSSAQLMRAIASMKGGDRITNNVSIESTKPVQDASDMMVELTKLKRRRLG